METIWTELAALGGVILIDIALAADNAVVVGLAAAGLPPHQRRQAIVFGIAAAAILRIVFALIATQLLALGWGLLVAGGLLLLWVAWKLWREIIAERKHAREAQLHLDGLPADAAAFAPGVPPAKTLRQAVIQITLADVSMSLDNVLAVAGLARDHMWVLVVGLALSVALMAVAATFILGLLKRFPWLSVLGLIVILFVAGKMLYEGVHEALAHAPETAAIEATLEPAP